MGNEASLEGGEGATMVGMSVSAPLGSGQHMKPVNGAAAGAGAGTSLEPRAGMHRWEQGYFTSHFLCMPACVFLLECDKRVDSEKRDWFWAERRMLCGDAAAAAAVVMLVSRLRSLQEHKNRALKTGLPMCWRRQIREIDTPEPQDDKLRNQEDAEREREGLWSCEWESFSHVSRCIHKKWQTHRHIWCWLIAKLSIRVSYDILHVCCRWMPIIT